MARAWLMHLRESAIFKLEDLDDEQLRWKPAPTANSLGVLVMHLGYAERLWVRAIFAGEPMDMTWRAHMFELPDGWSVADVIAFYRAETAAVERRARRGGVVRSPVDRRDAADDPSVGGVPSDRGDGPSRRSHGHHTRADRRSYRALAKLPACALHLRAKAVCP